METRTCRICNETKPPKRFKYVNRNRYNKTCKDCLRKGRKYPKGKLHPRHAADYFKLGVIDLYNSGYSSFEIVQKLNLPVTVRSLQRFLKRQGVQVRSGSDAFRLAIKKGRMSYENLRKVKKSREFRKGLGDRLRFQILKRDRFRCVFCGCGPQDGIALQIDHIVRPEDGGTNSESNLRTLCNSCNQGRYHLEKNESVRKLSSTLTSEPKRLTTPAVWIRSILVEPSIPTSRSSQNVVYHQLAALGNPKTDPVCRSLTLARENSGQVAPHARTTGG